MLNDINKNFINSFNYLSAGTKSKWGNEPSTLNMNIGAIDFFPLKSKGYFLNITKNMSTAKLQISTLEV